MRRVALAALVAAAGCGGDDAPARKQPKLRRDRGGAAPVVVVDREATSPRGKLTAEVEPNDSAETATALAMPGSASGSLASDADFDVYAIVAETEGALSAQLDGAAGTDLVLELRKADGSVLARSDSGAADVTEGLPNFPVAKGKKYFLTVTRAKPSKKRKKKKKEEAAAPAGGAASPPYTLVVALAAPAADSEVEPNAEPAQARSVMLGDDAVGYLGWADDVDVWKLDLTGFSPSFGLDVTVEGTERVALELELLDPAGKKVAATESEEGMPALIRGLVSPQATSFLIARLSGKRSNPRDRYKLEIAARRLSEEDEREPNDDADHATLLGDETGIKPEGTLSGFSAAGDVDYYRFEARDTDLVLDVAVTPPRDVDLSLAVRAGGSTQKAAAGKAGVREELTRIAVAAGKTAYVVVTGQSGGRGAEPYQLTWTATTGAPEVDPQQPDPSDFGDEFND